MKQPRLPDGFVVQIDPRVRTLGAGSALLGGSPMRLLRLAPAARKLLDGGRVEVRDARSAQLARTLLDATVAHPRPATGPSYRDISVVIPVCNNRDGVRRLVTALRGMHIIVVDDGSTYPLQHSDIAGLQCDVEIVRHQHSKGPAAARNTGLALCTKNFVAFVDSDVVPHRGWLEVLLGHFCDPAVALVAPRVVGLKGNDNVVARYEAVRSSLDLGHREAPIIPYSPVSYAPSAAIICRRSRLVGIGGFDETLLVGEDVDVCWRLVEAGARLRYDPIAIVAHEHRTRMRDWFSRKICYGKSAAPLAVRHPDNTAPMVVSAWSLVVWLLAATGSVKGYSAAAVVAGCGARRIAKNLRNSDAQNCDIATVTFRVLGSCARQLASGICRHYWPVTLMAMICSRRCRRIVAVAALSDGIIDWHNHSYRKTSLYQRADGSSDNSDSAPLGPGVYVLLRRLDDLAYGLGLWMGAIRQRSVWPLKPHVTLR